MQKRTWMGQGEQPMAWHPPRRRAQQGFSMIEMLVAVAIGLMVTATVLYTVSGSGMSGRKQNVQASIHDQGMLALVQLADHLRMAGFWMPSSEVMPEDVSMDHETSLFGCRGDFTDPSAPWSARACSNVNKDASDTLALRFEVARGGRNWDCLGSVVISEEMDQAEDARAAAKKTQRVRHGEKVSNEINERIYVKTQGTASGNPGLFCRSNIPPTQQPNKPPKTEQLLADNVDQLRIFYGVSPINGEAQSTNVAFDAPVLAGRTEKYVSATDLVKACQPGQMAANSWCAVDSVRLCLVMRSDNNVNEEARTPYVDCDGKVQYSNDRRLRQAFTMTVALRNKVATQ